MWVGVEVGSHARVTTDGVGWYPVVVGGVVSGEADEEFQGGAIVDVAAVIEDVFDEKL